MIFEDRRWTGARQYFISKLGTKNQLTILSGLLISIICPILPIIQNIIFGVAVNILDLKYSNIQHIIRKIFDGVRCQTIIISDTSKLQFISSDDRKFKTLISRLFGYLVYLIPAVGIVWFSLFFESTSFGCRNMNCPFLLDNSIIPSNYLKFNELYQQRKEFGEKRGDWDHQSNGELVWNAYGDSNSNYKKYWELNNLTDFIKQFNFVGFHDICNYPAENELKYHEGSPKRFLHYYPGYDKYNSTGQNLNDIWTKS